MEAYPMTSSGVKPCVSLRSILDGAVFVGAEDILAMDCQFRPAACGQRSVLVYGLDAHELDPVAVDQAIEQGAVGIITERLLPYSIPQCLVPDARHAFATLSHAMAGSPTKDMLSIGVMGTHGKTTTSLLISAMLKQLGGRVGYRTTLGVSNGVQHRSNAYCDPNSNELSRWLKSSLSKDCPAVILELTDRMLTKRSASGLEFDVLVLPSLRLSQRVSHLEMRAVETAMLRACDQLKKHGLIIYNADDARLNQWIQRLGLPAIGYGLDADADVRGKRMQQDHGFQSLMVSAGNSLMPMNTPLIGDHNARHMLAAVATGYAFGLELHEVIGGVERMSRIPGRMQSVQCGQDFPVYVDSADHADRIAVSLHALSRHGNGSPIVCVAEVPEHANGDSRAAFGRVLERSASKVILTQSRRPASSGQALMWEVLDGCERPAAIQLVPNRAAAIELALRSASPGEQVLLAGWGADKWTSGNDRTPRCDWDVAEQVLRATPQELSKAASIK